MGFFAALIESMRRPAGFIGNDEPSEMLDANRPANSDFLRPQRHALALEPRVMFDGAAATAATDPNHQGDATKAPEAPATAARTTASAPPTEAAVARVAGAPAPHEIIFILAMSTGYRVHDRVGGLRAENIAKWDGLR